MAVSPARVVAAFDENVTRPVSASVTKYTEQLHISEYTDVVRDWASTPLAISILALTFEAYGLRQGLVTFKHWTDVPLGNNQKQPIFVPDLFALLEGKFWGPFTLWLLTSVIGPLAVSYFINVPLKAAPSHNYGTRRATTRASVDMQFDPFTYFIAKALISYVVFGLRLPTLTTAGVSTSPFSGHTAGKVNESIHGGYVTVVMTSAIGALISLYEAVLRK